MTARLMFKVGAVVLVAGLFAACGSDDPADTAAVTSAEQPSGGDTLATVAPAVTSAEQPSGSDTLATVAPDVTSAEQPSGAGTTAPAPEAGTPSVDDLCTVIPDLATIEATIGVPVTDPLSVGDAGSQQTCGLIVSTTGGQDVNFTLIPNYGIAAQTEFVKSNFNVDIVPLEGAEGFYAGEGISVYWEGNGNLYQVSAVIAGDGRAASLDLLMAWLGM